jgi:hypothetical protein
MTLNFPNDCRSFDTVRNSVSFWGHDATFEVTFMLDASALRRLTGVEPLGESAALAAFDAHLAHIRKAALKMYQRHPKRYCELSGSDL